MFGAFAPMPIRLGGDAQQGWSASQQSRVAADVVALFRASPLAVLTIVASTGEITSYHGQHGVGLANAPTVTVLTPTFYYELTWENAYDGPLWALTTAEDQTFPFVIQQVQVHATGTDLPIAAAVRIIGPNTIRVTISGTGGSATVEVWGLWLPLPQIGTYGGDPNKENSLTEGDASYASVWYQELQGMRGSAYTQKPGTFVHAENLALARFWGYFAMRLPEKVRANTTPARADERLRYWAIVLGVGIRPGEETWSLRQRCVVAYRLAAAATYDRVNAALSELLGDTLVGITFPDELPLSVTPDFGTYWPFIHDGDPTANIGGGTWTSSRATLAIKVDWLPTMTWAEFKDLVDVQMWALLDTMLPAHMTWTWYRNTGGLGFLLDSTTNGRLDIDGFDP